MAIYIPSVLNKVSPDPENQQRLLIQDESSHVIHFLSIPCNSFDFYFPRAITTEATVRSLEHALSNTSPVHVLRAELLIYASAMEFHECEM